MLLHDLNLLNIQLERKKVVSNITTGGVWYMYYIYHNLMLL